MRRTKLYFEATSIVPEKRSGIGHALLEILRELDKERYKDKYEITAFVPLKEGKALGRFNFSNVKVKQLPFTHRFLSLFSMLKFGAPLDLFLGRGIYIFPNYRNFNLLNSTSITFIYDVCYILHPEYVQPKNLAYLRANMSKWLARTDHIVTSTEVSKNEIVDNLKVNPNEVHVAPLGVDRKVFFHRSKTEQMAIASRYGIKGDYFLFVGSIEPRKNLAFVVRAFASSEQLKPFTLFLVGGDGWLNDEIYQEIDKATQRGFKIVKNAVYVPDEDIPALMSGSKGVLLPSHHEGFGLSAIQADACQVPVIASDIAVLREVGDGVFHYFNNADAHSLVTTMLEVAALKDVESKLTYSWEETVLSLEEIFRK